MLKVFKPTIDIAWEAPMREEQVDEKSFEGKTFQNDLGIWHVNRVWWNSELEGWCDICLVEKSRESSIPDGYLQKLSVKRLQKEFQISDAEKINDIMKEMGY